MASAAENDSVAHVLYRGADPFRHRQAEPPDSARPVTVLTIMRRRGAWRALLNEDLVPLSAFILESREDEAERPR